MVALAQGGKPTTFITLTSNPATGNSPASRARTLARAWPKIVKRAKKKYGYAAIPYLCVFEATKKGEPHLHILARVKWLSQAWLSEQMLELTNAPIVDIRQVKNTAQVAHYISKYIGKEPHRFTDCKRYWSTRGWLLLPAEPDEPDEFWTDRWYVLNNSLAGLRRRWAAMGYDTAMEGRMLVAMARAPPEPH